jgi:hypothetical protein
MLSFFHGSLMLSRAVVCRTLFIPMFNAQQRLNRRIFNTQQSNIEGYLIVSRAKIEGFLILNRAIHSSVEGDLTF